MNAAMPMTAKIPLTILKNKKGLSLCAQTSKNREVNLITYITRYRKLLKLNVVEKEIFGRFYLSLMLFKTSSFKMK